MRTIIFLFFLFGGLRAAALPVDSGDHTFNGIENFKQIFPDAEIDRVDRQWEVTTVGFHWNGYELIAWFDQKGELVATSGLIDARTLPISVEMSLRRDYEGYTILEARQFFHEEKGLSYYLIVKKGEKALILKADTEGRLSVEKKVRQP
jgi:hypothetical protein